MKSSVKNKNFVQVELVKDNVQKVCFIPIQYAQINSILKIRGEDGWVVNRIYSELSEDELNSIRYAHKHHRDASDI